MQIATGQRYHAVRSFSTLIEMLRQSDSLYGEMPAFRYRDKPDGCEQIKTYQAFLSDINCLGTALMTLPLQHTFENTAGLYYLLYSGGCICFNDGLRYFLKNMKEWQIEVMIAVPLLFEKAYDKLNDQLAASNHGL